MSKKHRNPSWNNQNFCFHIGPNSKLVMLIVRGWLRIFVFRAFKPSWRLYLSYKQTMHLLEYFSYNFDISPAATGVSTWSLLKYAGRASLTLPLCAGTPRSCLCVPAPLNWTPCWDWGCMCWFTAAIDARSVSLLHHRPTCYTLYTLLQASKHSSTHKHKNTDANSFTIRAAKKIKKIRCKHKQDEIKKKKQTKRVNDIKSKRERTRNYPHWM